MPLSRATAVGCLAAAATLLAPSFISTSISTANAVEVIQEAPRPRFETAGLAIQLELGRYDGGYGLALAYYLPLHRLGSVPWLSVGAELGAGRTGGEPTGNGARVHGFVALGVIHRAVLTAGYAVAERDSLRLHGIPAADQTYWGPDLAVGYELLPASGPGLRVLVGGRYARRPLPDGESHLRTTLVLALGWKLW